jgi:hypothetical protein
VAGAGLPTGVIAGGVGYPEGQGPTSNGSFGGTGDPSEPGHPENPRKSYD